MTSTATQRNSKVIASNPPITNGVIVIWFWFLHRLDEDETSERKPKQSEELVRIICCSWGISQTTLWQKAHSRLGGAARPGRTPLDSVTQPFLNQWFALLSQLATVFL